MASSSKASSSMLPASSSKRTTGHRVYGVTPLASSLVSQDTDPESVHKVQVYNAVRVVGDIPSDKAALFLPASAEECSVLVNNFRRFPNSAPPAFHLSQYAKLDKLDFHKAVANLAPAPAPATFYPPRYIRTCSVFSEGRASLGEGLLLFQALSILQRAFAKIINGHHSKADNSRRVLQLVGTPNISACFRYYHDHWHYTSGCPLFASLLIVLVCDFCEDHLSPTDYKRWIYNSKAKEGFGMSAKTRQRIKACLDEPISLKALAIPIPFDPTTREGQIIVTIASRGTDVDQIRQPYTDITLRPDPSKRVVTAKSAKSLPPPKSTKVPASQPRPSTPEEEDMESDGSSLHGATKPSSPQPFPVPSSPIAVDEADIETDDVFPPLPEPPVSLPRRSLARAAKAKPVVVMNTPATTGKRERTPSVVEPDVPVVKPPSKKRRTHTTVGKARAITPKPSASSSVTSLKPAPRRIQEGEPDYFEGDDVKTENHQYFVTNPNFKPKAPFSDLISKSIAQNPRAPKLPFLRPPKWKISEELKDFGAFVNSADTSFSLQGLSRYSYMTSRHLQTSLSTTLPSPEALHSTSNCLSCLSRGIVCEGGNKLGGPCAHCDRTHRQCSNCLALEEHKDRFLAIHNTIQGFPAGYSGSLDRFHGAINDLDHVHSSFETLLNDSRQRLARSLQEVRLSGFDYNVVLSKWAEDNPNLPLEYDMLVWLATFFGWDSSCNISQYLVNPADTARLEAFLANVSTSDEPPVPVAADTHPAAAVPPTSTPAIPSPSSGKVPELSPRTRRRPSAAVPSNFHLSHEFHSPLPESPEVEDNEMEVEESTSHASVGRTLLAEDDDESDDEDEDDNDGVEVIENQPPISSQPARDRK
ncbi:hypothetical protein FB446DRAFT_795717 [Lentinula raphanica]|nr:hypothetical protein FB446DRAFT_795717 [Lentinula raphanica]